MSMISGQCKLCGLNTNLQESHIIPEFFYKPMYDQKHRFTVLSSDPDRPERYPRKGLREYLMCQSCDGKIVGKYDDYGAKVIFGGLKLETKIDGNALRIRGIDYPRLKLFFMSLVWRMGVADRKFWSQVSLGPFEQILRERLFKETPGAFYEFPCLPIGLRLKGQIGHWMREIDKVRIEHSTVYRVVISGILFLFFVSKCRPPKILESLFLKEDGTMSVLLDDVEKIPFLLADVLDVGRAMAIRDGFLPPTAPIIPV
jgi:hypothetical protein